MRLKTDIPDCIDVLRAVHDHDGYPAVWPNSPSHFLQPDGLMTAWIAHSGPVIIGHVALSVPDYGFPEHFETRPDAPSPATAEVQRLFVGPAARGKGVARALLDTATRHAQALGLLPILEVTMDAMTAIGLYERAGWRRTGTKIATWTDASGTHPRLYTYEQPRRA